MGGQTGTSMGCAASQKLSQIELSLGFHEVCIDHLQDPLQDWVERPLRHQEKFLMQDHPWTPDHPLFRLVELKENNNWLCKMDFFIHSHHDVSSIFWAAAGLEIRSAQVFLRGVQCLRHCRRTKGRTWLVWLICGRIFQPAGGLG